MSAKSSAGPQHGDVGVAQVQERLQVGEGVAGPQFVEVLVRQLDPVPFGDREDRLGLEGAFEVEVELCGGSMQPCLPQSRRGPTTVETRMNVL